MTINHVPGLRLLTQHRTSEGRHPTYNRPYDEVVARGRPVLPSWLGVIATPPGFPNAVAVYQPNGRDRAGAGRGPGQGPGRMVDDGPGRAGAGE